MKASGQDSPLFSELPLPYYHLCLTISQDQGCYPSGGVAGAGGDLGHSFPVCEPVTSTAQLNFTTLLANRPGSLLPMSPSQYSGHSPA
jgi:hypothetical protein